MNEQPKIRILFWPGWWYPDRLNPVKGIFIRRHAEAVAPLVDLAVLYVAADAGLADHSPEVEVSEGEPALTVRVYYRPSRALLGRLRVFEVWRYIHAARRGMRELHSRWGKPDIVHLHVSPPWGQVLALRAYRHRPFLFTEHWTGYHPANGEFRGFFRRWLNSWVVRHAHAVTVVSRDLQRVMEGHGLHGRYVVIPNAVRSELFHPPAAPGPASPFTFLHVSRLASAKNVPGILRAAAELRRRRRGFRLLIVGHGEERPELERLAEGLFPERDCVCFLGRKGENELAEIMRQSHCLILFSAYENLPCVVSEAMASGLPVIATRVGGVPEQVGAGTGILLEPGDEPALTGAMADVMDGAVSFDRQAIRAFAEENYSHAAVGQMFLDLYRQALSGRAGTA